MVFPKYKSNICSMSRIQTLERYIMWNGEGNDTPLQYSSLVYPMDRGAWWATVHGVTRVRHDLMTKLPQDLPELSSRGSEMWWSIFETGGMWGGG